LIFEHLDELVVPVAEEAADLAAERRLPHDVFDEGERQAFVVLGSISRNRFGRNLRIKLNLVKSNFVLMALHNGTHNMYLKIHAY
jgi:hypothetical protein